MFISQTGLTYFYKWPITCEIQILNLIKCRSGNCNRCDQRLFLLASRFFRLAKSLWNHSVYPRHSYCVHIFPRTTNFNRSGRFWLYYIINIQFMYSILIKVRRKGNIKVNHYINKSCFLSKIQKNVLIVQAGNISRNLCYMYLTRISLIKWNQIILKRELLKTSKLSPRYFFTRLI
jgi:hypothetical protein